MSIQSVLTCFNIGKIEKVSLPLLTVSILSNSKQSLGFVPFNLTTRESSSSSITSTAA
ncbi:MAG: hypothetical protein U0T83_02815 [Bacteriovoracaceae bacterium]